jgi:hypothetical protein
VIIGCNAAHPRCSVAATVASRSPSAVNTSMASFSWHRSRWVRSDDASHAPRMLPASLPASMSACPYLLPSSTETRIPLRLLRPAERSSPQMQLEWRPSTRVGIEATVKRPLGPPSSGVSKDGSYGTEVTDHPLGFALAPQLGFRVPYGSPEFGSSSASRRDKCNAAKRPGRRSACDTRMHAFESCSNPQRMLAAVPVTPITTGGLSTASNDRRPGQRPRRRF